jgi:hypothetical protein
MAGSGIATEPRRAEKKRKKNASIEKPDQHFQLVAKASGVRR